MKLEKPERITLWDEAEDGELVPSRLLYVEFDNDEIIKKIIEQIY